MITAAVATDHSGLSLRQDDSSSSTTHATLDADAPMWETVRETMQSFLKHLDPPDEAEDIEGIFVQFAPKPTQPFEIGNVTISDAPAQ